jgi:hypothetical protein
LTAYILLHIRATVCASFLSTCKSLINIKFTAFQFFTWNQIVESVSSRWVANTTYPCKGMLQFNSDLIWIHYHYQKICFNCHQLTCRLIPSYYSFTSKLIQKNFSCTVTVHNAQWLCIEVVLKCYLSKIQVTA